MKQLDDTLLGRKARALQVLRPLWKFLHELQQPKASPWTFHGSVVRNRLSSKLIWVRDTKSPWGNQVWVSERIGRETSLMIQWLRICLAVQGIRVQSLVRELSSHMLLQLSPCAPTTKPTCSGAHAPQLESLCAVTNELTWCSEDPLEPQLKFQCSQINFFF